MEGNYGVRFWDPAWQEIIFDYTNRILAAGFDGVYLDKVDEFEEMGHRDEMVEFVSRIAARAKSQRPDFLVVSQNGDGLFADTKFRRALDGFAREDLLYGEDSDGKRNSAIQHPRKRQTPENGRGRRKAGPGGGISAQRQSGTDRTARNLRGWLRRAHRTARARRAVICSRRSSSDFPFRWNRKSFSIPCV